MSTVKEFLKKIQHLAKILLRRYRDKPAYEYKKISKSPVNVSAPKIIPSPSVIEEKKFFPQITPKPVIDVKNSYDWQAFFEKLNDLSDFDKFFAETNLSWLRVHLDRVRGVLKKMSMPSDFDNDDLNFELAKKVRDVSQHMLTIFRNAKGSTDLTDNLRKKLINLVEDYLKKNGVEKKIFKRGDSSEDWSALGIPDSIQTKQTENPDLAGTIAEVEVQPCSIGYIVNKNGDVEEIIFGGVCTIYKR